MSTATGWLLDTNVVSELRKPNCNASVRAWSGQHPPESFFLSTLTLAEIRFGIEQVDDVAFQQELTDWLGQRLRPWFSNRILAIDEEVILVWRKMVEKGRKVGYTFSQPDLFIAATAAVHDLTVVTRNVSDFERSGVMVFNPFQA
ncbi:VapC toxin family PIN domain ribonuclease [filamentous cyanobacterium CCP5]|nr:VapC toxin family PIN domain ribonuclease [filamentous cyanobacterium CCP5]